jgi:dihydrofolate synthase/folylpolyglutamate synthase
MEKAGIIKTKIPVVCGEKDPELMALFRRQSEHQEAPFYAISAPITENQDGIPLYQHYNFALAQKGLSLLGYDTSMEEIQSLWPHLFSLTGFFGRLTPSLTHPRLWYDVSHNPAGFKATMESLKLLGSKKLILIFGASNDKEVSHLIEYMHEPIRWYFAEFSNPRSIRQDAFLSLWPDTIKKRWQCFDSVGHALADALHTRDQDTGILVTGSFFLLSDVREIQQTIENHLNQ